ncbi:hypothetical protein [Senegalia massiliensis]|uniref:hypothetical protein n=1 Tax=Senegalia massiliensis TaxID=1720316 RepID=UPI0010321D25|nr:hypothetical protein [Senegalia massiliensis]
MKNKLKLITILIIILFIYITNLHYPLRSYLIMYPLKIYYKNTGLHNDININIPTRKINNEPFYPFMLYFNSKNSFSKYIKEDAELSISYNFGGFKFLNKYSNYYDEDSELFSSFYGAYIINSKSNKPFGFKSNGDINIDLLEKVPEYDQKYLVLRSLGLNPKKSTFKNDIIDIEENIEYIESDNWIKVDSKIRTNSPNHNKKNFQRGYIQFGNPKNISKNYPIINMYGRMYVKYFKNYDKTIGFYILGKNKNIVDKIDNEIMSKSYIN